MTAPRDPAVAETLDLLRAWTPIRSVAGDRDGLARMAAALSDWLVRELGATLVPGAAAADPPIVHARLDIGAPRTVVLYNMYDVMPADPAGWSVAPFTGGEAELPGLGPAFLGRGAENNKGPLAGMLVAARRLLRAGRLGVNLEILVEGQEESGSGALRRYLAADPCPAGPADAVLFPSLCEYGGGPPRIYLGFKGIATGEIRVEGGAWGGPEAAIHSSNAPWIANPAWRLVSALAAIAGGDTGTIGTVPLDAEAQAIIARLAERFDPEAELRFRCSRRYAVDGTAAERLAAVLATASLNLSTLRTDPPDGRAVTPHMAAAGFELRLPPGLDPAVVLDDIRGRLRGLSDGVAIDLADAYPGCRFPESATGVAELATAYRDLGAEPQIWPWAIGSAPGYAFARIAPAFLIGGLGHGGNAHGIDEFVTLDGLARFLRSIESWLLRLAALGAPSLPDTPGRET
ncbi:M20/M25/M40 family metallo-hydrolase [Inquilinus sp. NPDC058860]|uniref:M20/M25/M40 family metallo-hydrolase n=1 Tax=Inquilinus sp. NPDC058860 TaxID=3346652 RepID=UPI0036837BE0